MGLLTKFRNCVHEQQERERARREDHARNLAWLRVKHLDAQLALAVAKDDRQRGEEIMAQLKLALAEYKKLPRGEAAELERRAELFSNLKEKK